MVELMVVVVIIGILVAIAIPIFNNVQANAANKAHAANIRTLLGAGQMAVASDGVPTAAVTWTAITSEGTNPANEHQADEYLKEWPTIPAGKTVDAHTAYRVVISTAGAVTAEAYTP